MKVAFFIGGLNRGGTETLVLDTFRRWNDLPFESILIYRNDGDLSDDYRATGIKMIRIKPRGIKLGYVFQLRRVLQRERVDILHAQTLLNAFLGLFCISFSRTKLIVSFHGLFSSVTDRLLTHFVLWFADASIFVSDYVQKWYMHHSWGFPKNRAFVVYNGIDFSKLDKQYSRPDFFQNKNPISEERSVKLAMVGSFVEGRSQLFVCKCLKELRDKGVGTFQFYFIGKRVGVDPDRFDDCVKYCTNNGLIDRVHFLGERNDVPSILQHIDGFVYSTVHDTFGIAVVEAIAAGVPVIVNDWAVMNEITENGQLAILYESNNIDDCISKMEQLILRPDLYRVDAKAAMRVVRLKYSIDNHINALFKVYEKTVI
jgi:glycosyltransferase involved in cell wall biosynthesis